jgi:hypothetical protein
MQEGVSDFLHKKSSFQPVVCRCEHLPVSLRTSNRCNCDDDIKRTGYGLTYNTHGRNEKYSQNFICKNESKTSFGRPRRKWEKIRQWILYTYNGRVWSGLLWLRIGYWRVLTNKAMKLGLD